MLRYGSTFGAGPFSREFSSRHGWAGKVVLELESNADGFAREVRVKVSSGFPALDQAKSWRIKPLAQVDVPFEFKLR